jgi:hypothetical protein
MIDSHQSGGLESPHSCPSYATLRESKVGIAPAVQANAGLAQS